MTRVPGNLSHARLSASQIGSITSKIKRFPGKVVACAAKVDVSLPEAGVQLMGGMRRVVGVKLMMAMLNTTGNGTRQRSKRPLAASGAAQIIGMLLKSLRWAEAVEAISVLRKDKWGGVTLNGAGVALRRLQAARVSGGAARQPPPRKGQIRMGGASLQRRVVGGRTNGVRDRTRMGGASHQLLTHSRVAGASRRRMIGVRRRPRVHASKKGGASQRRVIGGNLPPHVRASRVAGASQPNRRARRSPAQAVHWARVAWEASHRLEMQAANGVSHALIVLPPALINQEQDGSSVSRQIGRLPSRKTPRHGKGPVGMQESLSSRQRAVARAASRYRLHNGARPGVPLLRIAGQRREPQTTGISPRRHQSPRRAAR